MIKDIFKLLGVAVLLLLFVALFLALFFGVPALVQWCINSIAENAHSDFRMGYWLTFACWMVLECSVVPADHLVQHDKL